MGIADRDYTKDLYQLLGLGRHVSSEELRYAYEQAMSAATRSGDMVRARTLLGAYEALSRQRRDDVYGRTFSGQRTSTAGPTARRPSAQRPARRASGRRPPRPRRWGMSLPIRALFLTIVVPAAVIALVGSAIHLPHRGQPSPFTGVTASASANQGSTGSVEEVTPVDAALYVEQLNTRDDVTCVASGSVIGSAEFTCRSSDGASWLVRGSSPEP